MSLLGELPISLGTLFCKRFIVVTLRVVWHNLRWAESVAILHVTWLIVVVAHYELTPSCRNSILVLLLGALAQSRAGCTEVCLALSCLNAVQRILDLFLLAINCGLRGHLCVRHRITRIINWAHIAVILLLGRSILKGAGNDRIGSSVQNIRSLTHVTRWPVVVYLTARILICSHIGQFNKIFEKPLVILTLVADPAELFWVCALLSISLRRVLAYARGVNQNTISIGEKLLVSIRGILTGCQTLFLHGYFHVIRMRFGARLYISKVLVHQSVPCLVGQHAFSSSCFNWLLLII